VCLGCVSGAHARRSSAIAAAVKANKLAGGC
jgi:hypothetical protein